MLLKELMESVLTSQSALDQLISNANKMYTLYADVLTDRVKNLYALGEHEDMKRTAKTVIGRAKGKWFADNYLSTSARRERPIDGLKSAISVLTKDPKYNVEGLSALGSFVILANSEKQAEVASSSGQYVSQLENLPTVMNKLAAKAPKDIGARLSTAANRLGNAIDAFYSLWNRLHEQWDRDWGPNRDKRLERQREQAEQSNKQQATGGQYSQVEQLVNQVLGSIDKRVAAEIRPIIARSDNKLAVLQQELTKRGIKI